MTEQAPQRAYPLRRVFNALRWLARAGAPWRYLPHDFPAWHVVYQQVQRWIKTGCFEALVHDLRALLRLAQEREAQPSAVVLDARTLQSTVESGPRAGYDGHKRRKGSKIHLAVDTLGYLLAAQATPANQQERAQVGPLTAQVQQVAEHKVEVAFVDQGYTGASAATAAQANSMELEGVRLPQAKHGFVLLPRRWVVERSFAWLARFRRLARDYERLPTTLVGLHFIIFAWVMLSRLVHTVSST